jgi:hypothetical protein
MDWIVRKLTVDRASNPRCMVIQQFPHLGIAFAAIPAHAEAFDQLLAGAGSLIDGFADLSVGHCFADTDIHISNLYPNPLPQEQGETHS